MSTQFLIFLLVAMLWVGVISQSIEDEFSNPCTNAATCGECIRISAVCTWCRKENLPRGTPRCDILENLKRICPEANITNPPSSIKVNKDDAWNSGGQSDPPIQVKPQELEFKLRPNEPMNFRLKFQQQANYPVDLYFLLDLSYGMVREKQAQLRLIALGENIPVSMKNITNNFQLGFGTFVDKLLMPYTAWTDQMLADRCPLPGGKCRPPHDFKNQLNLGANGVTFKEKMKEALETVSQSIDDAEGGLDGLIQALDCDKIGWRPVSRRIIVYSSNSLFHLAGNGKLGGATKQSDLVCALDAEDEYQYEKLYDYPSVSQIASKLREKKANVIFAVMDEVIKDYRQLQSFLDGAVVGALANDSKNIVELISNKYYELRSRIKFQESNADNVEIKFKSKCLGDILKETAVCENLEIMDSVEFDVTLTVKSDICKGKEGIVEKDVSINAVGLNEQLLVKLKVQCDCPCEGPNQEVENSDKCSKAGTAECGICNCNTGHYGRTCECDETEISSKKSLEMCRDGNETLICSGNGECICGECKCFTLSPNTAQTFSGAYCECNDYSCPIGPNGLCGGSTHGTCVCGKCNCLKGWSGPNCECTTDQTSCMATNGKMCNGFGTCKCGRCICDPDTSMVGPTCEDCPTCPTQCSEYIDCAQCAAHGTGKFNKEECDEECKNVDIVDTLKSGKGVRECEGIDVDGCTFFFTYQYTKDNEVVIKAQKTKDCPDKAPVAAIVGGTVAAVVLLPLLIICLIIFFRNRRDAKEYADFMKEREKARWESGANPIYKDPKSTFQNPTYKGGKK